MDKDLFFYELEGRGYTFQNKKWDETKHGFEDDMLNMAWEMWSSAKHSIKAQAVPDVVNSRKWISCADVRACRKKAMTEAAQEQTND